MELLIFCYIIWLKNFHPLTIKELAGKEKKSESKVVEELIREAL